jgi:putative acetyltransferase
MSSSLTRIVPFTDAHAHAFKALNLLWLDEHNLTEVADLKVLNDPQGTILDQGGFIFVALSENKVIGTVALIRGNDNLMELAKMTVDPMHQGKGISKLLIDTCIAKARSLNIAGLYLYSSTKLQTALKLYEKYGFAHMPLTDSPYATADVYMKLSLS